MVDTEFLGQVRPYLAERDASVKRAADRVRVSESSAVVDSPTPVNPGRIEGYKAALESRGVAGQASWRSDSGFWAQPTASRAC